VKLKRSIDQTNLKQGNQVMDSGGAHMHKTPTDTHNMTHITTERTQKETAQSGGKKARKKQNL
jgi:hypothetical protein